MSSIFEPRLKPLPSTFFSQDGDVSPDRSPILRRSASFSGYAPYKLLDDSDDGHSNEVSRAEPQDPMILWPDTDDESQIEQAECDAWTIANPKTFGMETKNPEAREEKALKTTEEAHFKIQVSLETALLPSRNGEDFDHRLDERSNISNFLPSTLQTFPNCMHRGYEEFGPSMSRPAEMEHERSDGHQVLSLKLEVLRPHEARFKNWNRGPVRRSKPLLERESDLPGTLPENTNPKQTVPQQVMQALKAGEAALQKARALMPAVNMKPRTMSEVSEAASGSYQGSFGKGRGRK